jgi:hypothetical protein
MFLNIRLGLKWLEVTNTLAYDGELMITAVKIFVLQAKEPML